MTGEKDTPSFFILNIVIQRVLGRVPLRSLNRRYISRNRRVSAVSFFCIVVLLFSPSFFLRPAFYLSSFTVRFSTGFFHASNFSRASLEGLSRSDFGKGIALLVICRTKEKERSSSKKVGAAMENRERAKYEHEVTTRASSAWRT